MYLQVNPKYDTRELREFLSQLPKAFEQDGTVIYSGRNTLKSFCINGQELIVKRYHPLSPIRSLLYLGHSSKGARAYEYGLEFMHRGIQTPEPVAYVDVHSAPFQTILRESYFISLPLYAPDMTCLRRPGFDCAETERLSQFVYKLQQRGILHGDLNLTNILLVDNEAREPLHRYALIDTNRTYLLTVGQEPTLNQRAANLMRLTHRRDLLRQILRTFPACTDTDLPRLTFRLLLRMEARKRVLHRIFRRSKRH